MSQGCDTECGGGSEREQCCLLHSLLVFSHFLHHPQSNWALLVLIPGWVVCVHSRTLWVSPMSSPVRLGASPSASTPTGVFSQRFEALFPHCSPGLWVCLAPSCSSQFIRMRMWDRLSASHCLALSPLHLLPISAPPTI